MYLSRFRQQVEHQLKHTESPDALNDPMLNAWHAVAPTNPQDTRSPGLSYSAQIQEMWRIRRQLRFSQRSRAIQRQIAKTARAKKRQALTDFLDEIDTGVWK